MDEKTSELMGQLKDGLISASDGQIAKIIREARDEALAEAKAIIKDLMVQSLLESTLDELESVESRAIPGGEAEERRSGEDGEIENTPSPRQPSTPAPSEEQIRREIETIRRKIAENERLLSQVKASPIKPEEVQAPPVEDESSAPIEKGEEEYGYYVYGIVGCDGSQLVEGLPEKGIDPAYPVYAVQPSAISHQPSAISAIVSKVSLREFGQEELEAHLNDIQWVEAKAHAHQGVLETVLASHTLIPMKFCTIYRSESHAQEMLVQYYDHFVEALARLEGKKEWGVKVYCDGKALAQRVEEVNDRVKVLQAEMERKSSGVAYFLKKKIDEALAEEVERVSDEHAQRSHERLSSHAEEVVVNPLQTREITGRKEAMVLNGAYLVAEDQLPAFQAEVESLEEEYSDRGFSYELTGPWPPYNFVSLGFEESAAHE